MTVTTWRYHLPNDQSLEGWAICFLDSTGCFSVLSDWGNYGYRWSANGWGPGDFRAFFVRCDDSYVIRKIARSDEYKPAETLLRVKRRILEGRRSGGWTRERAREEWDILDGYEDLHRPEDFARWYDHTKIDCAYDLAVYDFSGQAQAFMKRVMPRLRERIRADLAAEAQSVTIGGAT